MTELGRPPSASADFVGAAHAKDVAPKDVDGATDPRGALSFVVRGPIARDDLPGLSARVCALFGSLDACAPTVVQCEVSSVAPDAVTIEALARLKLVAQRAGRTVRLCHASDELMALVAFLGLSDVLTR